MAGCVGGSTSFSEAPTSTSNTTSPEPTEPTGSTTPAASDAPVTVITLPSPETPVDYGIYRDVIFGGAKMHRGSIEFINWWAVCVGEQGFSVTVIGPEEIHSRYAEHQEAAYRAAFDECDRRSVAEGIVADGVRDFPDPDRLRIYYRAYVEVAYECLQENGEPTNPPPSSDEWVENYPNVWHPHDAGGDIGICSQDPIELLIELGKQDEANQGSG